MTTIAPVRNLGVSSNSRVPATWKELKDCIVRLQALAVLDWSLNFIAQLSATMSGQKGGGTEMHSSLVDDHLTSPASVIRCLVTTLEPNGQQYPSPNND
jgi:hypothetical protein